MDLPQLIDSRLTVEGRTAILTFDREDVGNSFVGTALAADVLRVLDWAELGGEISVLAFTGRGYAFSEEAPAVPDGGARSSIVSLASGSQEKNRSDIGKMISAVAESDLPLIAAVNGPATGIGLILACLCDIRIGSNRAELGRPISDHLESAGSAGAWSLRRLIGHQKATEMVLSGRAVRADEALAIGLLFDVVEPESQLLPTVGLFASRLSSKSTGYLRRAKRLMSGTDGDDMPNLVDQAGKQNRPEDRRLMEV